MPFHGVTRSTPLWFYLSPYHNGLMMLGPRLPETQSYNDCCTTSSGANWPQPGTHTHESLLFYKGWIPLGPNSSLRPKFLQKLRTSPTRGHEGYHKTLQHVKTDFLWLGLKAYVRQYIKECDVCQCQKAKNVVLAGLLQPLPILSQVLTKISMDFINGLPSSHRKDSLMVVVDCPSKYEHFFSLTHTYTATKVAKLFLEHIFKLHGML